MKIIKDPKDGTFMIKADKGDCVNVFFKKARGGEIVATGFETEDEAYEHMLFALESPSLFKSITLSIRISEKLKFELNQIAIRENRSLNNIIENILIEYVKNN